jgi:tetratricopeptide (TPR) repeat protein
MNRDRVALVNRLALATLLWAVLLVPCEATASNKANDLKMIRSSDGRTKIALQLERSPRYSLQSAKGNRVLLTLFDTVSTPGLGKRLSEYEKSLTMETGAESSLLTLTIPLERPPREVETSWLPKEKVLYLEMAQAEEGEAKEKEYPKPASLKNLRFGIQDALTRMVADLDRKPSWEMVCGEGKALTLKLSAIPESLKREQYGPLRRLKKVTLNKGGHEVSMTIEPESRVDHLKMFWLRDGGKWVVDFFDLPVTHMDGGLRFTGEAVDKEAEKPSPVAPVQESEKKETQEEHKAQAKAVLVEEAFSPEMGSAVRMKIPKADEVVAVKGESGAEKAPAESLFEGQNVGRLSSDEAFLFGRIQEATELKDYEKGVALTDQFLARFPNSSLNESLVFMACDFRFGLLESGRKGILPEVIKGYQEAIERFAGSKRVPGALVKIAQAHALAGNDYEAIGNLILAINQYREGDHVPEALMLKGKIYLGMNQVEKAIEDFKTILKRYPGSAYASKARYGIAGYFHSVGMYEEAEKQLKGIGDSTPEFHLEQPDYLFLRARNFFYQKNYDMARDYYFRALNLGHQPESADLLISHIGDTFHHQSREKEAAKLYEMAVAHYPESEGASIAKLRLGSYSSGVSAFEEVHEKNINKPVGDLALLELATKLYGKGQHSLAMETLRKLLGKPNRSDIQREAKQLFCRSFEKEMKGLFDAKEYEKLLQFYQSEQANISGNIDPESVLLVGESLQSLRRYPEAVLQFSQIKPHDLSPASRARYLLVFANTYITQGDDESAETLLQRTPKEKLLPNDQQRISLALADIYQRRGDLKRSLDLYQSLLGEKRLLSDTDMATVYLSMGKISNRESRFERARESLNRCIALAEKDKNTKDLLRSAFVEMGNSYHLEGRHAEAIRSYQQGFDLDYGPDKGGYWEVKYRLALSHLGAGENAAAERIMGEISEEGDPLIQQKVQIKLGLMGLDKQLKRLPLGKKSGREVL